MLNKKILAAAVAASLSTGAFAVQDISDSDTRALVFASELQSTTGKTTVVTGVNTITSIRTDVGFGFSGDTTRYIRFDLDGAEFETAVKAADLSLSTADATLTATLLDGGQNGDGFALFQVATGVGEAVAATDKFTLAAADLTLVNGAASTATYAIFEGLTEAAGGTASLKSFTGPLASFGTAVAASPIKANNTKLAPTATVSSGFTEFNNTGGTSAIIGQVADEGTIKAGVLTPATGVATTFAEIFNAAGRQATVTGDFSFVDSAYLSDSATCSTADPAVVDALTINEAKTAAVSAAAAVDMIEHQYVCLTVDGDTTINKGSYSLSLARTATDVLTGALASVVYDTLSVEVPYLTTFEGYNQRLFIVNTGSIDASYSFSFTSEDGVTVVEGSAAEGVVPARSMVAIKATDIVELTGKTRTSAVIELEADDQDIKVTSQTVNLSDATTDTVVYY